jgi:hypothetical protein
MQSSARIVAVALTSAAAAALLVSCATSPPTGPMGFFVTSANPGNGGNLGGLTGADAHCQKLAAAAGAGSRTWRAYLSTSYIPPNATSAIHARDRIGKGPWFNAKGALIASDLTQLHGSNNLNKLTALTEKGTVVNGRGDTPNMHDILTGSRPDGTAYPGFPGQPNLTCGEWTRETNAFAVVGHHDRLQNWAGAADPWAESWNSSHLTVSCSKEDLPKSGGAGLFYCFATD